MKIFSRYPRVAMREKNVVYSEEELLDQIREGVKNHKQCIMSLYSFEEIYDKKVRPETAVIDCAMWKGERTFCENKCKLFPKDPSIVIDEGKDYIAIVFKNFTREQLQSLNACTDLEAMIIVPGCLNLQTGKKCTIIGRNNFD
jgi:hypothetical protein